MRARPYRTWLVATMAVLVGLPLIVEAGLRGVFYQRHGRSALALVEAYGIGERQVNMILARMRGRLDTGAAGDLAAGQGLLFTDAGAAFREELEARYAGHFAALAEALDRDGVKLVVMRLAGPYRDRPSAGNRAFLPFIRDLCARHGAVFIDMHQAAFAGRSERRVTLQPEDGHLSRLGHQLVAQALTPVLEGLTGHRARAAFAPEERPERFADLHPGLDEIQSPDDRPYRVVTNRQGLRMDHDLTFPKKRQRILFLGDSITFAAFVNQEDSFPGLLQKRFSDREFMNAGNAGYTVSDYLSLWRERARYAEPDIVVLQTHANDLMDLMSDHLNAHDRDGRIHTPSEVERRFMEVARSTAARAAPGGPPTP